MKHTKKLLVLLLSFIMLILFIGCDLGLLCDDSGHKVDTSFETSSKTTEPKITSTLSGVQSVETVWIPRTGSKFHKNASCSNMKNPIKETKQEAERRGYKPCKNCYYQE